jgi:predicted permease
MKHILNWFRRGTLERDLDRELAYHMDRRVTDLMDAGLPEPEARRRAALELGGATQVREEVRDVWLTRWLRDLVYDLRFSARAFRRDRSFTLTAVLSLALGIGATTAIYSLVDQVVLRPLPVSHPERLVLFDWHGAQLAETFGSYNLMSYPLCRDLQEKTQFFDGVFCRALTTINLSTGHDPRPAEAELVSGSYFPVLGVKSARGRLLTPDDDQVPGTSPVAVVSWEFWNSELAGDPDIVGRKILVNQYPMTVVGVAEPAFHGIDVGEIPSLWIPATMSAQAIPGFNAMLNRRRRWMQILGRLRPDVSVAQARTGLQPWFKAMLQEDMRRPEFPRITADQQRLFLASTLDVMSSPQGHSVLRRTLAKPLWIVFAATAVLLSLACLNVAGLFLARGSARQREISTRLALGASRGRIGRQFLADSLLLALAGGVAGLALAPVAVRALVVFLPHHNAAGNGLTARVDGHLLLFTFAVSLASGVLAGSAPALQAGGGSLIASLRDRAGTAFGGIRLRRAIVIAQIALTLILVIAAGLFVRTLSGLVEKGPGFDTASLVSFGIKPSLNGYSRAGGSQLAQRIADDIRRSPATRNSGVAQVQLLLGGIWGNALTIRSDRRFATDRDVNLNAATPGFFATLGARILAGRDFTDHDALPVSAGGKRVAIVNEAFVQRYFGGRSPLGAWVCMGAAPDATPDTEIVGVVEDFSYRTVREASEQAWFSMQDGDFGSNFYVRFRGTPESAFRSIRAVLHKADPTLPISYFQTLDDQVNRSLNTERLLAALSSGFGTLALLLSLVGLYGVMSFVVTRRTREIGIRLAMGATRRSAVWLVLRDALTMIAAGTAIALPCVWALGRLVESQLFDVDPTDPMTIVVATAVLCSTALGAAFIPARRASAVNPSDALRFE